MPPISDLHSLFDAFLSENCFPSNFAFLKDLKKSFQLNTRIAVETPGGYLCVMSFGYDIAQIVRGNWHTMVTYSNQRHSKFKHLDFSINKAPPIDLVQPLITISLVLSTDGVCVSDSSTESELWPVWLAIAHLPPKLRFSRKNNCLASLICGNKKPPWRTVVNHLKAELDQVFIIENHKVQFGCVKIVADIPAKANVVSIYKNNGYNDCNLCTADGKTIGKSHSYYPFEQEFEYRTPELNDRYVEIAEALNGGKHMFNVVGVKGRSEFGKIVPGLPLAAGITCIVCFWVFTKTC